jgi:hypothetical protein
MENTMLYDCSNEFKGLGSAINAEECGAGVIFGQTTSIAKAVVVLNVVPGGKEFNFLGLLVTRLQTRLPSISRAFLAALYPHHRHIVCEPPRNA